MELVPKSDRDELKTVRLLSEDKNQKSFTNQMYFLKNIRWNVKIYSY